jgi:hypothetical protein
MFGRLRGVACTPAVGELGLVGIPVVGECAPVGVQDLGWQRRVPTGGHQGAIGGGVVRRDGEDVILDGTRTIPGPFGLVFPCVLSVQRHKVKQLQNKNQVPKSDNVP